MKTCTEHSTQNTEHTPSIASVLLFLQQVPVQLYSVFNVPIEDDGLVATGLYEHINMIWAGPGIHPRKEGGALSFCYFISIT